MMELIHLPIGTLLCKFKSAVIAQFSCSVENLLGSLVELVHLLIHPSKCCSFLRILVAQMVKHHIMQELTRLILGWKIPRRRNGSYSRTLTRKFH